MKKLYETSVATAYGEKQIAVYEGNVLDFPEEIDILTTSAFYRSYSPSPRTLFAALYRQNIWVDALARQPEIDLRQMCDVWLSKAIENSAVRIRRIGCIELSDVWSDKDRGVVEQRMLNSIKAYFQMLDIAATYEIKMDTVALPLLGAGNQNISANLTMIPILNECTAFLKRNSAVKRICFIDMKPTNAALIAKALEESYLVSRERSENIPVKTEPEQTTRLAFISYASPDKNIADNLCARLERHGIKVWYAPRDVRNDYATAIAQAIGQATHFIVILSKNSMGSQHVLNEIDLAFQGLPDRIKFRPLRIDDAGFAPAFNYYLSRQHWMDAHVPPLEQRLDEYVESFLANL